MKTLQSLYDRVVTASAAGDANAAHEAFLAIVGLRARGPVDAVPTSLARVTASMLRYDTPRLIDLYALFAGARDVAKFEDLSVSTAERLERQLVQKRMNVVRVGPYTKRFDVAVSDERQKRPDASLFTVIASRAREAHAVAEAERDRSSEGTRRAGLALGYPPCCVEHFVAVEQSAEAEQYGINEAAFRATEGLDRPIPWEMNPLSLASPIGFSPCRTECPEALAFARRVLSATQQTETLRRVLSRPILFFRFPIFYAIEPAEGGEQGAVRYARAVPNDDGTDLPAALRAWQHFELEQALGKGNELRLDERALSVLNDGELLARWSLEDPQVPRLLQFTP